MTTARTNTKSKPNAKKTNRKRSGQSPTRTRRDIYQEISDRIISMLDSGELLPWHESWEQSPLGHPHNAISGKPYRGINRWLTEITPTRSSLY